MKPVEIQVVDSHTAGEPTRVVLAGGPELTGGTMAERAACFAAQHDHFRAAVVNEPRGSDVLVGALLCEPASPGADAGVLFFNNVGLLGMCGHGAIGVAVTLRHLGRIPPGPVRLETPVGEVVAELLDEHTARIENVPACRFRSRIGVDVPGHGKIKGDIAWGGNWFFLTQAAPCALERRNAARLAGFAAAVRCGLEAAGVTGEDGAEIDHIELVGPPAAGGDARNFVLCPGGAYDRSPCGTGTSAKLACLAADRQLPPGRVWRQEGILGSVFEAEYQMTSTAPTPLGGGEGGKPLWITPQITGSAYVTGRASLVIDPEDPFAWGLDGRRRT